MCVGGTHGYMCAWVHLHMCAWELEARLQCHPLGAIYLV